MKRGLTALALLLIPAAAEASTLPRVDFEARQVMVSVGLPDASVDVALSDRLSLGASAFALGVDNLFPAARATYRLADGPGGLVVGVTLSAGLIPNVMRSASVPLMYQSYVQPAANVTLPLGGAQSPVRLRATLGPLWYDLQPSWYVFIPNVELGIKVAAQQELTLGGNSLIGWRGLF